MKMVYNFSAGPAVLPKPVLEQARDEMLDWHGSGMSVMEMSHRGEEFMSIIAKVETDLRELVKIPSHYKILFLQGGASSQFAMVPLNLLKPNKEADYVNTGQWSQKAIEEASKYGTVNIIASSEDNHFTAIPAIDSWKMSRNAAYLHYTSNETIGGVEFNCIPDLSTISGGSPDTPLVADMSSNFLSRPVDVSRFGLIYAGAQKNIGPAGLVLVIIREDLVQAPIAGTPTLFSYQTHVQNDSMYNTPPTYAIYMMGLVLEWLKNKGGYLRSKH